MNKVKFVKKKKQNRSLADSNSWPWKVSTNSLRLNHWAKRHLVLEKLETIEYMCKRVVDLFQTESATRGPQLTGWKNQIACFHHACLAGFHIGQRRRSPSSGRLLRSTKISTWKNKQNKKQRGILPPKSRAANTMVVSVCPESAWRMCFEANSSRNPKHGNSSFGR